MTRVSWEGAPEPPGRGERVAQRVVVPLALALIAILLVFYVLFSTAIVSGPSMIPTLKDGDRLLLTKSYNVPHRGDVIVTVVSENGTPVELVKRVIAIPGDRVEIRRDVAYVNGVVEPKRGQVVSTSFSISAPELTVAPGYLYVMGDNRPVSEDSRFLGPVPLSGARGRVLAVFAPITRIGLIR
jgi:signal peptidase I